MEIEIKDFFKIKNVNITTGGVHFVAGPVNSGKTSIRRAIGLALAGGTAADGAAIKVEVNGISAVNANSGIYGYDAKDIFSVCSFSEKKLEESVTLKNGKKVVLKGLNINKCEEAYKLLLAERETTSYMLKGTSELREHIVSEIDSRKKALVEVKAQNGALKRILEEVVFLSLIKTKECPLYSCKCGVESALVETSVEDRTNSIKRLSESYFSKYGEFDLPEPGLEAVDVVKEKINAIVAKTSLEEKEVMTLEVKLSLMGGMNLLERLMEIDSRLADGKALLETVKKFKRAENYVTVNPEVFVEKALLHGLVVTFDDGGLKINGAPYSVASRAEKILASFSVQEAAKLPIIICDDLDCLVAGDRGRLVKYAVDNKPAELVLFLGTSAERPKAAPGVRCWFLNNGVLEAVDR